ncbi:MAG: hypothetical protein ACR2J3_04020 [Aridibacter sp.]
MKILVSISVFTIALIIGCLQPTTTPTLYEKTYPRLTQNEIQHLVGKKVIYRYYKITNYGFGQPLGAKYSLAEKVSEVGFLKDGDTGEFVNLYTLNKIHPVWRKLMRNCDLVVKWDEKSVKGNDLYSCYGRHSMRIDLEVVEN